MRKLLTLTVFLAVVAVCPRWAMALEPEEVLVVANEASEESVDLAEYYIKQRDIPEKNLVKVKVSTAYEMSRSEYDKQIVEVLRKELVRRRIHTKIKAVALMWGIPVRVAGGELPGPEAKVYRNARTTSHHRMAIAQQYLVTVGKDFPRPETDGLTPLHKLFEKSDEPVGSKLAKPVSIRKDIAALLRSKAGTMDLITDDDKKKIAWRQLMAIQLDTFGLEGLVAFIKTRNPVGAPDVETLQKQIDRVKEALDELDEVDTVKKARLEMSLVELLDGQWGVLDRISEKPIDPPDPFKGPQKDAAVDSELALLWYKEYKLEKFHPNPLNAGVQQAIRRSGKKVTVPTLMTARIDGPTVADAKRIIKESVAVERKGLQGNIYIDAGGKLPEYDRNLLSLYQLLRKEKIKLGLSLDKEKSLYQRGDCPDAALYVGWYSLKKYIPAFRWQPGAVGWHIASFEAMDLRNPRSRQWCPQMIRNGVAATVGAVNEPYLGAFPLPQEFFPMLLTGEYTLAECYWLTNPFASWRMTLIGDPLYNPFKENPQYKVSDLPEKIRDAS